MAIWFTSDTHFGHKNIIKYSNRPYRDIDEMNRALIANWQEQVHWDDEVYHLGDFSFLPKDKAQNILDQLPGRKHLILGNHDKGVNQLRGWEWIRQYHELHVGKQMIVMSHYAMRVFNKVHRGAIQLYGHSHGLLPGNDQQLDVGVDCWNYRLVTLDDIQSRMRTLPPYNPVDHHRGRGR